MILAVEEVNDPNVPFAGIELVPNSRPLPPVNVPFRVKLALIVRFLVSTPPVIGVISPYMKASGPLYPELDESIYNL